MKQLGSASNGALFSNDDGVDGRGLYRYLLWRDLVDPGSFLTSGADGQDRAHRGSVILWCGLNPSTAHESANDPTCAREIAFSRRWGYTRWLKWNLFSYRSTDPAKLRMLPSREHALGDQNLQALEIGLGEADAVVCAWGADKVIQGADAMAMYLMTYHFRIGLDKVWCLKITQGGYPQHPLYLKGDMELIPYRGRDDDGFGLQVGGNKGGIVDAEVGKQTQLPKNLSQTFHVRTR